MFLNYSIHGPERRYTIGRPRGCPVRRRADQTENARIEAENRREAERAAATDKVRQAAGNRPRSGRGDARETTLRTGSLPNAVPSNRSPLPPQGHGTFGWRWRCQVARETYHSLEAVDRYLGMFDRIRHCRQQNMQSGQIAYILNCSPALVHEYLAIDRELEQQSDPSTSAPS